MVGRLTSITGAMAVALASATAIGAGSSSAQDAARGEHVFRKCILCHVTDPAAKDLVAPPLHNIIGRRASVMPGFDYSDIMKLAGREGLFWSAEALFYFLDRPEEFMPGTYMAFSGLDEQERRDVIAYLERVTADWKRSELRTKDVRARSTTPAPQSTAPPQQQRTTRPATPALPR